MLLLFFSFSIYPSSFNYFNILPWTVEYADWMSAKELVSSSEVNHRTLVAIVYCCIAMIQLHVYIYVLTQNLPSWRTNILLKKNIPLTLYAKGLCVRGELETEQTATYWPQVPLTIAALLFLFCWTAQPGVLRTQAFCWELVLTASNCNSNFNSNCPTNSNCLWHRVI